MLDVNWAPKRKMLPTTQRKEGRLITITTSYPHVIVRRAGNFVGGEKGCLVGLVKKYWWTWIRGINVIQKLYQDGWGNMGQHRTTQTAGRWAAPSGVLIKSARQPVPPTIP